MADVREHDDSVLSSMPLLLHHGEEQEGEGAGVSVGTHGLSVALLERLWVLDLAYRDCLYLFRRQDAKLDRARSLDRPVSSEGEGFGQPKGRSASATA